MARSLVTQRPQSLFERRLSASPFSSLFDRDFGRLAREMMSAGWPLETEMGDFLRPQMNISETDKDYCVTVDLPGVSPSDLDVSVEGDMLTIKATRNEEKREEKENFHVMERQFGTYQRMIQLPVHVDPAKVEAQFDKGVLKLTVPKGGAEERARKIEVRSGEAGKGQQAAPTAPPLAAAEAKPGEGAAATAH